MIVFLIKWFLLLSGLAFWVFMIWVFSGVQKSLVFTKEKKIFGYIFTIKSEAKKNLTITIKKEVASA